MRQARIVHTLLRVWLGLVILFLLLPILVVVPLSLSSASYLRFPPPGWSLRWYVSYFTRDAWTNATWLSLWVGLIVAVLATVLGTLAAFGLTRGRLPLRGLISALIVSPLVIPTIVAAMASTSPSPARASRVRPSASFWRTPASPRHSWWRWSPRRWWGSIDGLNSLR